MAELSLAAVSLLFQAFSGCVQGYELITDARHMPGDCQYLRVRLKTEQYRLLDWAEVVRLDDTDENLLLNHTSKSLVRDILEEQWKLLYQFGRLDNKYKRLTRPLLVDLEEENDGVLPPPPAYSPTAESPILQRIDSDFACRFPQSQKLLQKSLDFSKKFAKDSKDYPKKLKWAVFDKTKMEGLLVKLSGFNDTMREMLNSGQLESLMDKQKRTEFQIMQLNSSIRDLVQIFQSQALTVNLQQNRARSRTNRAIMHAPSLEDLDEENHHVAPVLDNLAALAQFKALNSVIMNSTIDDPTVFNDEFTSSIKLTHTASEIRSVELAQKDIHILGEEPDEPGESYRTEAIYHPKGSRKTSVWIEWKTLEHTAYHPNGVDSKVHDRIKALTALLKENNRMIDQFRAPHCLGYFQDEDESRFGLVFEKPSSVHPTTQPISLYTLLTSDGIDVPSLTDRIALMRLLSETLERLHAVNWLHKGLRSANILFFSDGGAQEINYSDPYISGFDYSRPAMSEDMTEKPPENASSDIYRHPVVQGSGNRDRSDSSSSSSYKKSYDLYSLGVILLEIAYWKPIDKILGIEDLTKAKPSVTFKVRERLLHEQQFLKYVKSHLGNTVEAVVRACLAGPRAFGLNDNMDEKTGEVGAELQKMFYERVVREFKQMRV